MLFADLDQEECATRQARADYISAVKRTTLARGSVRRLSARLQRGGGITGAAVDATTGAKPVGLCVQATNDRYRPRTLPVRNGSYRIGGLAAGAWFVTFKDCSVAEELPQGVNPPRYPYETLHWPATIAYDQAKAILVTVGKVVTGIDAMILRTGSITGRITAQGTGQPVVQICVATDNGLDKSNRSAPNSGRDVGAPTSSTGGYLLPGLPPGEYAVAATTDHITQPVNVCRGPFYWFPGTSDPLAATKIVVTASQTTPNVDIAVP